LQADVALQGDDLADGLVLDRAQLVVGDALRGVVLAGLQQLGRAQQAADVVGAEGWCGALGHGGSMVACEMAARTGSEVKTITAAWREFRAKRAPQLIACAI